jgi:hypothetical protein
VAQAAVTMDRPSFRSVSMDIPTQPLIVRSVGQTASRQ